MITHNPTTCPYCALCPFYILETVTLSDERPEFPNVTDYQLFLMEKYGEKGEADGQ